MLVLLFATYMFAVIPVRVQAAVGKVSATPSKVSILDTRVFLSGSGWTPGAEFEVRIAPTSSWTDPEAIDVTPTYNTFDDTGAFIPGTYIELAADDIRSITVGQTPPQYYFYILVSEGVGAASCKVEVVPVYGTVYLYYYGLTRMDSGDTIYYSDLIEVVGGGFTPGAKVKAYIDLAEISPALGTSNVATDEGLVDFYISVPDAVYGSHTFWFLDDKAGNPAQVLPPETAYIELSMDRILEVNVFSIRGEAGETVTITGHGFMEGEAVGATPADVTIGGVSTTHTTPSADAKGKFALRATLNDDIAETGSTTVSVTTTAATVDRLLMPLYVSRPDLIGDEDIDLISLGTRVDDTVYVFIYNFPAGKSVPVAFGSKTVATINTDDNGAGWASFKVPEYPADTYDLRASYAGLHAVASFEITEPRIRLYNAATGALLRDESFVESGTNIRVLVQGLRARAWYTIIESADVDRNIVEENMVVEVKKGLLGTTIDPTLYMVRSDTSGTIELVYTSSYLTLAVDTGDAVTVSVVGVVSQGFLAVGSQRVTVDPSYAKTGMTPVVTLTFEGLVPTKRYQILFDGAVQTVDPVDPDLPPGTFFPGIVTEATVTLPSAAAGVHNIDLVYFGKSVPVPLRGRATFIYSKPAGTATIVLSKTIAPDPLGLTSPLTVRGYNFDADELGVSVKVTGTDIDIPVEVTSAGSFVATITGDELVVPGGDYIVYTERAPLKPQASAPLKVAPYALLIGSIDPTPGGIQRAYVDGTAGLVVSGLSPNTRYVILFDGALALPSPRFTTDSFGVAEVGFTVPPLLAGDHNVDIALEAEPTKPLGVTFPLGRVLRILPAFTLTPNPEAITGQLVQFDWAGVPEDLSEPVSVTVLIDDVPSTTLYALYYADTVGTYHLAGSFYLPNGDPDVILKVTLMYYDSVAASDTSGVATLKRISGAGSLLIGVDLASDIAYIKGTVSNITVSLSELNAKVVAINGTLATIDTKLGTMSAKLNDIDAKLVSLEDDVATVSTAVGDIKVSVDDIGLNVTSIAGDVATIETTLGTISGKVTSIDGNVATIKTDLGTVKADVSTIKGQLPVAVDMTPVWIAVVLSLIAAIAAIAAVVQISRKIAG
jgi:archaellum component FlaC